MPNVQEISTKTLHKEIQCYICSKKLREETKIFSIGVRNRRHLCKSCRDHLYIDLPDDPISMSYNLITNGKTLSIEEII